MSNKLQYDENSIIALDWREAIRQNSSMYIGNTDADGLLHLMVEVVANSIDEAVAGYGKEIIISIDTKTNEMTVSDKGRGLPFRKNKSGEYAIVEACTSNHAGGKFEGGTGYKSSLGLHGLGLKLVNALSTNCTVFVDREDGHCEIFFQDGYTEGPDITDKIQKNTGTTVIFTPDKEIFTNLQWDLAAIENRIETDALLNNNIIFKIIVDGKLHKQYHYTEGTKDLFKLKTKEDKIITTPVFYRTTVKNDSGETAEVDFGFAYSDDKTERIYSYANGGYTPNDGTHVTGFKSAFTSMINRIAKNEGVLKDTDKNFSGDVIRKGLVLVLVLRADFRLAFAEQTKRTLNSAPARGLVSKAVGQLNLSKNSIKEILDKVALEQKAEDAAKRAKEAASRIARGGKNMNAIKDLPEKLADCPNRHGELFFVEGDSAAGSVREKRNKQNQACLALRGKVLNTFSKDLADIIENKEIRDILTCLGCGIGENFNINNLRYDKLIILSDADADGLHIQLLLMTLFLRHLPELVKAGHIYIAVPPLYKVTNNRGVKYYYSNSEISRKQGEIQRYKGLGEMEPDELKNTVLNPEKRKLIQVKVEDYDDIMKLYDILMGKSSLSRRNFIIENKISDIDDEIYDDGEDE